jgi:hypothetical protein
MKMWLIRYWKEKVQVKEDHLQHRSALVFNFLRETNSLIELQWFQKQKKIKERREHVELEYEWTINVSKSLHE